MSAEARRTNSQAGDLPSDQSVVKRLSEPGRPITFDEHSATFCSVVPRVLINAKPKADDGGDCWTFSVDGVQITKERGVDYYVLGVEVQDYGDRDTPPSMDVQEIAVFKTFLQAMRQLMLKHTADGVDAAFECLIDPGVGPTGDSRGVSFEG